MSKLNKLVRNPGLFFADALRKRLKLPTSGSLTAEREAKTRKNTGLNGTLRSLPNWFRAAPGEMLRRALADPRPVFLHVSLAPLQAGPHLTPGEAPNHIIAELDLVQGADHPSVRQKVELFALQNPAAFRRLALSRLLPLRRHIRGVIFGGEGRASLQILAHACEDLGMFRILIPHLAPGVRQGNWDEMVDPNDFPRADLVLVPDIPARRRFLRAGYADAACAVVGWPQFDGLKDFQPQLSHREFRHLLGLEEGGKIVLLGMAHHADLKKKAEAAMQKKLLLDVLDWAEADDGRVVCKMLTAGNPFLDDAARRRIERSDHVTCDYAMPELVSLEETLCQTDLVVSTSNLVLLPSLLLGKPCVLPSYVLPEARAMPAGVAEAASPEALAAGLQRMKTESPETIFPSPAVLDGVHPPCREAFDGQAGQRIRACLSELAAGTRPAVLRPDPMANLISSDGGSVGLVGVDSGPGAWQTSQKYLQGMLRAQGLVQSHPKKNNVGDLAAVEIFGQWGIKPSSTKQWQNRVRRSLGRGRVILEDGFIRSVDIGLSGEAGLSLLLDDLTAYYDATRSSRLELTLQHGPDLSAEQLGRARKVIDRIVAQRVSKYNHAPQHSPPIGRPGCRKILLIDQRYGDQSVVSGLADESSFIRMLEEALARGPEFDVVVKQHPDAIKGGKSSYFSNERLETFKTRPNLHLLTFDINPYSLLEQVDEVCVATSGMGFEALMAGKIVHAYGMPFYAGWGVTRDKLTLPTRTRRRSVEEIFHFAYLKFSRYFHLEKNEVVEIEELMDYIVTQRGW